MQDLPRADKCSETEDPQADVWLKPLAAADRKLGAAPVDFDIFLEYIIFQVTATLRNTVINEEAVEFIAAKDLRLYLTLGEATNVREGVAAGEEANLVIGARGSIIYI